MSRCRLFFSCRRSGKESYLFCSVAEGREKTHLLSVPLILLWGGKTEEFLTLFSSTSKEKKNAVLLLSLLGGGRRLLLKNLGLGRRGGEGKGKRSKLASSYSLLQGFS